MKFNAFAKYLRELEKVSSRIRITEILADLFRKIPKDEISMVVNLSLGQLAPPYKSIVFNIAEKLMIEAVAKAYGKKKEEVVNLYKEKGDLGDVAESLSIQKESTLSVSEVYSLLLKAAQDEGEKSVERKIEGIAKLLSSLDSLSARFVARIPIGKLRLGFSDKTILDALSWMENGDKSAKKVLENAYNVRPDVGLLAKEVKEKGIKKATKGLTPEVGIPISPMLSQRLKSPTEMIEKMEEVAVEPKLDGLRLQIHFGGRDGVKSFTRNLNETSWMFPELLNISEDLAAKRTILDVEAVGVNEELQRLANFQTTMTRRRKHEIAETAKKIPIKFYVFDILLKDETNLINEPYMKRRKVLEKTVKEGRIFNIVDFEITKDPKRIAQLNKDKKEEGLEGIMVKKISSGYVPGRTGWRWVKMKESEEAVAKLADTLDLIVMGYTSGKGKRAGFGIGQFLAGIKDNGKVKTVTKVGTGLTDEQFRELNKRLRKFSVREKPKEYEVHKTLEPDFWVEPELVVEIAADEITKSPTHTAGLALRFPRLVRFRDDKSSSEATTLSELKDLAKLQ